MFAKTRIQVIAKQWKVFREIKTFHRAAGTTITPWIHRGEAQGRRAMRPDNGGPPSSMDWRLHFFLDKTNHLG